VRVDVLGGEKKRRWSTPQPFRPVKSLIKLAAWQPTPPARVHARTFVPGGRRRAM
jgi:hypothetical protein